MDANIVKVIVEWGQNTIAQKKSLCNCLLIYIKELTHRLDNVANKER